MSNASRCRSQAAHYDSLALRTADPEGIRAFRALAATWREMAHFAEAFDRWLKAQEGRAKGDVDLTQLAAELEAAAYAFLQRWHGS